MSASGPYHEWAQEGADREVVITQHGIIALVMMLHANIDLSASIHLGVPLSALISPYFPSYFPLSQGSNFATHMSIIKAMNMRRVINMCKVSHVTITVLSFALTMSVMALYMESILPTLSPNNVTHHDDNPRVHYHGGPRDRDLHVVNPLCHMLNNTREIRRFR